MGMTHGHSWALGAVSGSRGVLARSFFEFTELETPVASILIG